MKLEIVTDVGAQELMVRSFIHRKILFALERWKLEANGVVRLQSEAEIGTGACCFCAIDLELSPSRQIHVSAHGESPYDCVLRAIQKLEQVLAHEERRRARLERDKGSEAEVVLEPCSLTEF